ncbi:MAG TPA: PqqD family protein [Syntrophomonadaceae bacterium]|nr:PqqD family protein [Syntrophomonadaceae bacterium]
MSEDQNNGHTTRRQFLIELGGIAGLAITGWYLLPGLFLKPGDSSSPAHENKPRLKVGYEIREAGEGADIYSNAHGNPICQVNDIGKFVLKEMDGVKTVEEIADRVARKLNTSLENLENFRGKIALFIARLAEAGLLSSAFYINVMECEVTS